MRTLRLASVCVAVAAATLASGAALAKDARPVHAPKNLHGFLLKPTEPRTSVFPRTPAFAWNPVRGARCYEFELSTSRSFSSNSVIWSNVNDDAKAAACQAVPADPGATTGTASNPTDPNAQPSTTTTTSAAVTMLQPLRVPAVSVDLALPWFTGSPYALYARVRAVGTKGPSAWSKSFGFNMQWQSRPAPLASPAGLIRWSTVEGATGYQVWFPQIKKSITTNTNVADQREFFIFHRSDPTWWSKVQWRVRAVRRVSGVIANGLPSVSYGQWSPTYLSVNRDLSTGPIHLQTAVSDAASSRSSAHAHELMPGLSFTGDQGLDGQSYNYFRAYVATDRDCVNIVFKGSVTGSPAFAPRTSGPLKLPVDSEGVAKFEAKLYPAAVGDDKAEGAENTWSADWRRLVASETIPDTAAASNGTTSTEPSAPVDESANVVQARVDLPDIDFPSTRYYWTIVPVDFQANPTYDADSAKEKKGFVDIESPQDACQAGRVASFGKESDGVRTGSGSAPFVSGLSPNGRFMNSTHARPVVYSTPLVAWEPATGATAYQVQWSHTKYPWRASGTVKTFATSAILQLAPGTWYYRVRGLNQAQMRRAEMAWSAPVAVKVAAPKFSIR
ncbi:MAG: hypothetical protein U0R50_06705 [Gaiellales bacterium]